jgi:maltose O-acetyltransferase
LRAANITKSWLRALADFIAPKVLDVLIRLHDQPKTREKLDMLFSILQQHAHLNYVAKVKARYHVHPSFYWGEGTLIYGDGDISIDENSYIGRNSFVLAHPKGVKISIGKGCAISHGVHIRTEINKRKRHYSEDLASLPMGADVKIGDYVWIGANAFIGGGITVGDNSIVGANSVVTSDVLPNSIVAGVPARVIGTKDNY